MGSLKRLKWPKPRYGPSPFSLIWSLLLIFAYLYLLKGSQFFDAVIEFLCASTNFRFTSEKSASALNDIERKRQCLFCFFLCFRLLAITEDGLLSRKFFLVATIRVLSEKFLLNDVEESNFNK